MGLTGHFAAPLIVATYVSVTMLTCNSLAMFLQQASGEGGAGRQDELSHSRTNQCACGAFRQIYAALPPSPTLALRRIENNLHNFQRFSVVTHHAYPLLPPLLASDFIVDVLFGNLSSSESAPIMKVGVPSPLPCAPRDRRRRYV